MGTDFKQRFGLSFRLSVLLVGTLFVGFSLGMIFEGVAGWRVLLDQGLFFIGSLFAFACIFGTTIVYEANKFLALIFDLIWERGNHEKG